MPLSPGDRLGPYTVTSAIGRGGMGEVFKARDTRLNRDVAIKVLPELFASDPERLARFEREAQVLASLNHANIAQVYGVIDQPPALTMEFVDGEDLAERLARTPLSVDDAIAIARQIAEALEAAHERSIVHRDLKPANIRLTAAGQVKILDFGLAKVWDTEGSDLSSASDSRTVAHHSTSAGLILGTAAYMAPEQARGLAVDKRADIWSFGVVCFEMLSGRRLFEGATLSDTLAAVLTQEPDLSALRPQTPDALRTLLSRCLQRDAKLRLRDIGEARIALANPSATGATLPRDRVRWSWLPARWLSPAVIALLAGLAGWAVASFGRPISFAESPSNTGLLTLGIEAGVETQVAGVGWVGLNWVGPTAVLSPGGEMLVFQARGPSGGRWQLYARRLDELKARALPGTEGAMAPFFSPDGASVGFFAGGYLSKVALEGGAVTRLCPTDDARGGAWSDDGVIAFSPKNEGPLFTVSATGGNPSPLTTLDTASGETTHRWPQFLPGGRIVIFTAHGATGGNGVVIAQDADGRRTVLQRGAVFGRYAPSGHLLYLNEGKLFAAPVDVRRLAVSGPAVPVVDDVEHAMINGTAQYSTSNTGLLLYRRAQSRDRLLEWMEPSGEMRTLRNGAAEYQAAWFSPDGTRLLLVIGAGAQSDIWTYDIPRDALTRLTFHPDNDWSPVWSPDGKYIVYSSWRADVGSFNLFLQRASGGGEPQRLTTSRTRQFPTSWHPDGTHILATEYEGGTSGTLMLRPIDITPEGVGRSGDARPLVDTGNVSAATFSPDGKWMAYVSDESGRSEVYVRPFPGLGARWQVSAEGAEWVSWRPGGHLFYGRSGELVLRVPYRVDGSTFVAEKPQLWMRIPAGVAWVDPSIDGTRAAAIRSENARPESMVLVVNFFERLRRLALNPR